MCVCVQGSMTEGRVPKEASVKLSVLLATALTPETTTSMLFKDAADAEAGAVEVAGRAARDAAGQYQSAVRLQNMSGQVSSL